jgi:hypothetical protein
MAYSWNEPQRKLKRMRVLRHQEKLSVYQEEEGGEGGDDDDDDDETKTDDDDDDDDGNAQICIYCKPQSSTNTAPKATSQYTSHRRKKMVFTN